MPKRSQKLLLGPREWNWWMVPRKRYSSYFKIIFTQHEKLLKIIENNLWHLFDFSEHRFRGCADALFIHDNKCTKELQRKIYIHKLCNIFRSRKHFTKNYLYLLTWVWIFFLAVTTIEDRLSVDVEVELCYCDKDECNAERPNGATFLSYSVYIHIFLFALSFL